MCIIIVKPKGTRKPDNMTLGICWDNNPDGAGIAIRRFGQKKVDLFKGFMTWKEFNRFHKNLDVGKEDVAVYHFRIGTSATNTEPFTHPFPISDSKKELYALRWTGDQVLAHNGIISSGTPHLSDTQLFIRKILADPHIRQYHHVPAIRKLIDRYLGSNKVVVLSSSGTVRFYGSDAWKDHKGCLYSNGTFWTVKTYATAGIYYTKQTGWQAWNDPTRKKGKKGTKKKKKASWKKGKAREIAEKETSVLVPVDEVEKIDDLVTERFQSDDFMTDAEAGYLDFDELEDTERMDS